MTYVVFVVGNEDLTEGRGPEVVHSAHVVRTKDDWQDYVEEARRSSAQGTPGSVYLISSRDLLYGPCNSESRCPHRAECVWSAGKYINREDDPDYQEYLRLKNRFEIFD